MAGDIFIEETRKRIDSVSSSFCVAKWKQVTVHLHTGQTHSCHHPGTHTIPLSELRENASALHNTAHKKLLRKQMLKGIRPEECQYCWNIEDLGKNFFSDRHIKSSDFWAEPHIDEIRKMPWDANVAPSYVEVSFSHKCNFKCLYCYPHISSSWQSEIETHGPIAMVDRPMHKIEWWEAKGLMPRPDKDNPYVDAFWKWLPEIYSSLKVLRVTGGEPLLSENTYRLLEFVEKNPHPELDLAINSNLGVHPRFIKRLGTHIQAAQKRVKSIRIYSSVDTWGPQAEYIRTGLKLKTFEENLTYLFQSNPGLKLTLMCTFNILSYFGFQSLAEKVLEWKNAYAGQGTEIFLDVSYLRHPECLSLLLADSETKNLLDRTKAFMEENQQDWDKSRPGFIDYERNKLKRLMEYSLRGELYFDLHLQRRNLLTFVKEMDRRRKSDFFSVFPEMKEITRNWQPPLPADSLTSELQPR